MKKNVAARKEDFLDPRDYKKYRKNLKKFHNISKEIWKLKKA